VSEAVKFREIPGISEAAAITLTRMAETIFRIRISRFQAFLNPV
jgi:hypothetical protein